MILIADNILLSGLVTRETKHQGRKAQNGSKASQRIFFIGYSSQNIKIYGMNFILPLKDTTTWTAGTGITLVSIDQVKESFQDFLD